MAKCPIDGCLTGAKPGHLMCLDHWKMVPRRLQQRVNDTWRDYRQEPEEYLRARGEAIAHVEGRAPASGQGSLL